MKPLKLTMSAFGPYASVEIIDFTKLKDKSIFLITGPTGAGKTTIFDGISYALFGEASGTTREKDSLRSDFASPETSTFVELEFLLRGKEYKVTRYPQQERKKSRGEGFLIKNADAELVMPNNEVITKVSNVDAKISELLGINKNQFRQIVMLPQGEFRKLLDAESKERELIFRKIFGTEAFAFIQSKLDKQSKELYKKIESIKTQRDTHVKHIDASEEETLLKLINGENLNIIEIIQVTKELIEKDREKKDKLFEEIKSLKEQQEKLQKGIVKGEEINKKLKDKEEVNGKYNELLLKKEEYDKKQNNLEKGRKALEVKLVEDLLVERENKIKEKVIQHKDIEEKVKGLEEKVKSLGETLKREEAKDTERKKLADSITTLNNYEEKVRGYEEKNIRKEQLKKKLIDKEKGLKNCREKIGSEKFSLQKYNEALRLAQEAKAEEVKLNKEVENKEKLIKEMRFIYSKWKEYFTLQLSHKKESDEFNEFEIEFQKIKAKYELMEDNFRRGQAGLLAKSLREGEPCPVCGSIEHPSPAEHIDGVPTEEELKREKALYDEKVKDREKRYEELISLKQRIKSQKESLSELTIKIEESLNENIKDIEESKVLNFLSEKGKILAAELTKLKEKQDKVAELVKNKETIEVKIKALETDIKKLEEEADVLEKERTELYGQVKGEEELIKNIEEEIPEDIRTYAKLSDRVNKLKSCLKELENSYKKAQDNYNDSKNAHAALQADKEARGKNIGEETAEIKTQRILLGNKIKDSGFEDYSQYVLFRMTEEEIKPLEKDIIEYHKSLNSLKGMLEKAKKETGELREVVIETLKEALNGIKVHQEQLEEQEKKIFARINNNKKSLKEIEDISKTIAAEEEEYRIIGELSSMANGFNSERITFERYVLAAYFDEIISAANIRLRKMSSGRFILARKEEKGKGKKQEGLELEIFDNYTGKARHVRTLSGGESFKASLALALGLADVVQSYAGGISLDTMFVDEGFGTLDNESLDNAIQCLIDLQKGGRLVGIISHVQELKERIDVRLEITPAKEGSKARFIV